MTLKEHLAKVTTISSQESANYDNHLLASGSVDSNIKIWDFRQKSSIHTLKSHCKPITDV